jgi:hypothetical protein
MSNVVTQKCGAAGPEFIRVQAHARGIRQIAFSAVHHATNIEHGYLTTSLILADGF